MITIEKLEKDRKAVLEKQEKAERDRELIRAKQLQARIEIDKQRGKDFADKYISLLIKHANKNLANIVFVSNAESYYGTNQYRYGLRPQNHEIFDLVPNYEATVWLKNYIESHGYNVRCYQQGLGSPRDDPDDMWPVYERYANFMEISWKLNLKEAK